MFITPFSNLTFFTTLLYLYKSSSVLYFHYCYSFQFKHQVLILTLVKSLIRIDVTNLLNDAMGAPNRKKFNDNDGKNKQWSHCTECAGVDFINSLRCRSFEPCAETFTQLKASQKFGVRGKTIDEIDPWSRNEEEICQNLKK